MLFDTLQIPERLLIAQEEGKLVVFAGAGVSVGPPSGLPSFLQLTEQIAGHQLTDQERQQLDHVLGRIHKQGIDVHAEAARILRRQGSLPTQLHRDLLRLFAKPDYVRVVTTNFDTHFRTAASDLNLTVPIYTAPALPRGGDFHGLVELHGSVDGFVSDLALTDRDFGRAYLTEGWARAFVERMFANYVVLFVGYSLTDPPMHYFARGLPTEAECRRYVITHDDPARWELLGVDVVTFQLEPGPEKYAPLDRGIDSWVKTTRGSSFQLEERIVALLQRPDPSTLSTADAELLVWSLGRDHTTNYYTKNARGLVWVEWLAERGLLKPCFDPRTEFRHPRERQLAAWLATQLTANRDEKERAFGIVRSQGGQCSRELGFWLRNCMRDAGSAEEWTILLVSQLDGNDEDALWGFGEKLREFAVQNSPMFWPLWSLLTTPEFELDPIGLHGGGGVATAKVALKGMAADLRASWMEAIKPRLPDLAPRMLEHLLRQWDRALELALANASIGSLHDSGSEPLFRVPGLELEHFHRHEPGVLIYMLVDVVEYLARQRGGLATARIASWLDSEDGIVRGLGLRAVRVSVDLPENEKIEWAQQRARTYPVGSIAHRLAQAISDELTVPLEQRQQTPAPVELPPVPDQLPKLGTLLEMDEQELNRTFQRTRLTPATALVRLGELAEVTTTRPALAENALWPRLLARCNWKSLDAAGRDRLERIVATHRLTALHPQIVLRSVFAGDPLEAQGPEAPTLAQIESLLAISLELWAQIAPNDGPDEPPVTAATDWLSLALSRGEYHLVQFWLRYVSIQPTSPTAATLPAQIAEVFGDVATRATGTGRRARATLIQGLGFLVVRDPAWTRQHLVPLFDFAAHGENAWVVWRAFLHAGQLNRPTAIALAPAYRASQARILQAEDKRVTEYLQDAASIIVHIIAPEVAGWPEELAKALPEERRFQWERLVGRELPSLTDDQQEQIWDAWLGVLFDQRCRGRIGNSMVPLPPREAAVLANWLPSIPATFSRAFPLVRAVRDFDFNNERIDWRTFRQSVAGSRHPAEFLRFVELLLARLEAARVDPESIWQSLKRLPRSPIFHAALVRVAEVFQHHGWPQAKAFKLWVDEQFAPGGE